MINAAIVLTQGFFLSGYIVLLKGSDFLVGILNNSAIWSMIISLFSFLLYERMEKRKNLLLALNIISRLLICSIVFLPLIISDNNLVLSLVTVMVIMGNIFWGIFSVGSSVWMMNILPNEIKNSYTYFRIFCIRISFTISTILMGLVLDWFNKSYTGFLVILSVSLLFSICDAIVLYNIKEPVRKLNKEEPYKNKLFEPLKNKKYRTLLIFVFMFTLSLFLSCSFTPLYLIKYLKLGYGFLSVISVISYITMIVFVNFWRRIEKTKGIGFVFKATALFIVFEFLIYNFITKDTYYLLFITPIISGIGNSGYNIVIFTYRYELMPDKNRTIYEGWFGAVTGLSVLLAPILGNLLITRLPVIHNLIYQHSNMQLLYLISFCLGLITIFLAFYGPSALRIGDNADCDNSWDNNASNKILS